MRTTNAEQMARAAGLTNGKMFRSRLRRLLPDDHVQGNWTVDVGSSKHGRMQRVLENMLRPRG